MCGYTKTIKPKMKILLGFMTNNSILFRKVFFFMLMFGKGGVSGKTLEDFRGVHGRRECQSSVY